MERSVLKKQEKLAHPNVVDLRDADLAVNLVRQDVNLVSHADLVAARKVHIKDVENTQQRQKDLLRDIIMERNAQRALEKPVQEKAVNTDLVR